MPTLATKHTCTGCSACRNICPHSAISINPDRDGFLMPVVNSDLCVECKLCEKACPIVNGVDIKYPEVKQAFAFWDNKTRTKSSSGGAFSAIARNVIEKGGVVFGAAWKDGFKCVHIKCETIDGLEAIRGSKYLQSDIGLTFSEVRSALKEDRYVLFTGTPCQIAGLRSFLLKPYEKLITVDIVCHGVPSNQLFCNYIEKLKAEFPEFANANGFEFRIRHGWGIAPSVTGVNCQKTTLSGVRDLYMSAFLKSGIFRKSCYDCRFNGLSRVSDISIADFWGLGLQGIPFRHDVSKGVSLVLVNTEKGSKIMACLDDCFMEERPLQEAISPNRNIVYSSILPPNRDQIIEAFNDPANTLTAINARFRIVDTSISGRLIKVLRMWLRSVLIKTGIFWRIKSIINKRQGK